MNWNGRGGKPSCSDRRDVPYRKLPSRHSPQSRKTSIKITGVPFEIRTKRLSDTKQMLRQASAAVCLRPSLL